jgi:uncharacterized repeat protein (TIGR01451 family)
MTFLVSLFSAHAHAQSSLSLDKRLSSGSAVTYDSVGDVLNFEFVVTNSGGQLITDQVVISDASLDAPASCPAPGSGLSPGASITCTGVVTITQSDLDAGSLVNTATASAGAITSPSDTVTVTAVQQSAMSLAVSGALRGSEFKKDEFVDYAYVVTNAGNVTITDPISVIDDKAAVTCDALPGGGLAPGASLNCSGEYTLTGDDESNGFVTNQAFARFTSSSLGTVTSPTVSETVVDSGGTSGPLISITVTANPQQVSSAAASIDYTYVLSHDGGKQINQNIVIFDNQFPGSLLCFDEANNSVGDGDGNFEAGETVTCVNTGYVVSQDDIDAGSIVNQAYAFTIDEGGVTSPIVTEVVDVVEAAALEVTLSKDRVGPVMLGDVITYTIDVENTGNQTISNISVTDPLLPGLECSVASLAPGASTSCSGIYQVTQADVDDPSGVLTNTSTAAGNDPAGNRVEDSDTESIVISGAAQSSLSLDKRLSSGSAVTYDSVGDVLNFEFVVTNSGGQLITDQVVISDASLDAPASCPAPGSGLSPGASITCTGVVTITQSDLDAGSLVNTATASAGAITSPSDTVTVTAVQQSAMSLAVSGALRGSEFKKDEFVDYAYVVTNAGNVTITDPISVIDDKAAVTCDALPGGGLAPGASLNCSGEYTLTGDDESNGFVTNQAFARFTSSSLGTVTSPTVSETVVDSGGTSGPLISITVTANPQQVSSAAASIDYTYVLSHDGGKQINQNIVIFDNQFPGSLLCFDEANNSVGDGDGNFEAGETVTCVNTGYVVSQDDIDAGSIVNQAYAFTIDEGGVTSPIVTEVVDVVEAAALEVTLSKDRVGPVMLGDVITYTIDVENTGNQTISNISVTDPLLPGLECSVASLAPGASTSCSGIYQVTQADVDDPSGVLTNTSTAAGNDPAGNRVEDSDTESIVISGAAQSSLSLDKRLSSGSAVTYDSVGDVLNFEFVVTNSGGQLITDQVVISDASLDAPASCPAPGSGLSPGASITCTGVVTITQSDLDAGSLVNTATASAGAITSPSDTVTVTAVQQSAMSLAVSGALRGSEFKKDEFVDYAYVVTNAGNVTITDPISVIDDKAAVTCDALPGGGLAPGASLNCSGEYTLTGDDESNGFVTNQAFARFTSSSLGTVTSPTVSETVVDSGGTSGPLISITVTANPQQVSSAAASIDYTYVLSHDGGKQINQNIVIFDNQFPGSLLCFDEANNSVGDGDGNFEAGETVTCVNTG